jgi:arginine deiminase
MTAMKLGRLGTSIMGAFVKSADNSVKTTRNDETIIRETVFRVSPLPSNSQFVMKSSQRLLVKGQDLYQNLRDVAFQISN